MSQVRVSVRFKDGQAVEFAEELANLYQPEPGSQEARRLAEVRGAEQLRHPDRIPKIQLPLSDGERVPVRYDPADRNRIVLDVPALQKRALHDYIQREQQQQKSQPATRPAAGAARKQRQPGRRPQAACPAAGWSSAGYPRDGLASWASWRACCGNQAPAAGSSMPHSGSKSA